MKAIIVGGGIGGLCAALCLDHLGCEVEVLEQASEFTEVGAGIQISPNGVKVLRTLGLEKAVGTKAFAPLDAQIRSGRSGRLIARTRMGREIEQRHGAPYWHLHRADLIAVLADAVAERMPNALKVGASVKSYGQDSEQAWVQLAAGELVSGDVVIGADGIWSAIRDQMLGPASPCFTGNVAWRAVVPVSELGRDAPPPSACVWVGEGKHAVTYLLRGGEFANFVGVVERDDWQVESWSEHGTREQAISDFAGWHPTVTRVIEQANAHFRWALFDREPLSGWFDGRVTLLGDACHPMLPFMAQGAVMAMEDGWVLARELLASSTDVSHGLARYHSARAARTAKVQRRAASNMGLFHRRSLPSKLATYGPMWMGSRLAPSLVDRQFDWLYGYDVTAA